FVLASDTDGRKPVAGAEVLARGQLGEAVTDGEGVAFAKVFAAGDRALVVRKDDRWAVGGFGRVFDGTYFSPDHRGELRRDRLKRADRKDAREEVAQVYADRHVLAAYTDRPTYRPGQAVQFKLIVRRLDAEKPAGDAARSFRSEDFDVAARLRLPDT